MDMPEAVFWVVVVPLSILLLVGFFCTWNHVSNIREHTRVMTLQLEQLLKASGVKDPAADRKLLIAEIEEAGKRVRKNW